MQFAWASAGGENGHLPPLAIETKNEKFLEKLKAAAQFRSIDFILTMAVYYDTHTACKLGSLFWCLH